MEKKITGRSLLTLKDYSKDEIRSLLDLSHQVKKEKGHVFKRFEGKTLALLFEKRSTRTRCAFETAFGEEGGHPVFLSMDDIQLGAKETVEDTARVLGGMFDCIQFRGFSQKVVETLAEYSGVPVYNGLTDLYHPTQVLADLMTIEESFGDITGKKLCFIGDGRNNVANSLMIGAAKMGLNYTVISPESLYPSKKYVKECRKWAEESGAAIEVTDDISKGLKQAEAVYTDVWASMGEEKKLKERKKILKKYQVTAKLMAKTERDDTIFLHCLPAVKGNEVTEEVFEGPASKVFDQAENRKHTIKAVMLATL
jgi:ornithine carbamoyltransferase